ncbi:phage tail tube protein [Salana multivorans]
MSRATDNAVPAGTILGKSFEYGLDVNTGTSEAPVWTTVRRMFNFQPTPTPVTTDAQTYDDEGSQNQSVTAWNWALAFTTQVNRNGTTGEYLPEVEALLARTKPSAKGAAAQIEVRWYHQPDSAAGGVPNPDDAGRGIATVAGQRGNIGPDGSIEIINWTLTGVGAYEEIENPLTADTAPAVTAAAPTGAETGDTITITGTGFTGVTGTSGVTIGGTDATSYTVDSATQISAVVPAGSAGSAPIVVTHPTDGASAPFPYTRG